MTTQTAPDEFRWDGWVTIAWLVAWATCAASVWLVVAMGTIEVPRLSALSSYQAGADTLVNWGVWGWAIGQSVAAFMLAALFSIANGAYRNSCRTVAMLVKLQPTPKAEDLTSIDPASGLRVEKVHPASPLEGVLRPGCRLLRINGHEPGSGVDAAKQVVKGKNHLVFCNLEGEVVAGTLNMIPGPLHITFTEPA